MAATVRFDNPLGTSVSINVRGTKEVLDLAKETTGLVSFVHCSSGYVHCHLQDEIIREGTRISYIKYSLFTRTKFHILTICPPTL